MKLILIFQKSVEKSLNNFANYTELNVFLIMLLDASQVFYYTKS